MLLKIIINYIKIAIIIKLMLIIIIISEYYKLLYNNGGIINFLLRVSKPWLKFNILAKLLGS